MRNIKFLFAIICAGVGASLALVVPHLLRTSPTIARRAHVPLPVQVAPAQQVDLKETIGANGSVQPIALVKLTARLGARVEKIVADLGDVVAPGQPLVHFDQTIPTAMLETARAARDRAALDVRLTMQRFQRYKTIYEQGLTAVVLSAVRAAKEQAAGDLQRATLQGERIKALYEQQLVPLADLEKAQATVQEAQTRANEAEQKLLQAMRDLHTELETAEAALQEARAHLSEAEEKLIRAQRDVQNTTLVSPVSAILMERLINVSETPNVEQPLLTLGQIDHVLVETKIPEERIGDIALQQPATVTFNAFPNEVFKGQVVKIKPVTDLETRTFLAYVRVANPALQLKPGLTGFVRIAREQKQVLGVPSIALINPTGVRESAVFVVENGTWARLRKVQVGAAADGMTAILHGLTTGEQVVVAGQFYLRDGDQVRIGAEFENIKAK